MNPRELHEGELLGSQKIAEWYQGNWDYQKAGSSEVQLPFQIKPGNEAVQHIIDGGEHLIVKSAQPYGVIAENAPELERYQLNLEASTDDISVFEVPEGMVTLPALLNDAIEGDRNLILDVFLEIGLMANKFQQFSENTSNPILPKIGMYDVGFVKGRWEPILLPPIEFEENLEPSNYQPQRALFEEILLATRSGKEEEIFLSALEAFKMGFTDGFSRT